MAGGCLTCTGRSGSGPPAGTNPGRGGASIPPCSHCRPIGVSTMEVGCCAGGVGSWGHRGVVQQFARHTRGVRPTCNSDFGPACEWDRPCPARSENRFPSPLTQMNSLRNRGTWNGRREHLMNEPNSGNWPQSDGHFGRYGRRMAEVAWRKPVCATPGRGPKTAMSGVEVRCPGSRGAALNGRIDRNSVWGMRRCPPCHSPGDIRVASRLRVDRVSCQFWLWQFLFSSVENPS
jgi:hypothetical protein